MSEFGETKDPFYCPDGEWPGVDAWFIDSTPGIDTFTQRVESGMTEEEAALPFRERLRVKIIMDADDQPVGVSRRPARNQSPLD